MDALCFRVSVFFLSCAAFRLAFRIFRKTDALLLVKRCVPQFKILRMEKRNDAESVFNCRYNCLSVPTGFTEDANPYICVVIENRVFI